MEAETALDNMSQNGQDEVKKEHPLAFIALSMHAEAMRH